jgi:DNA-binding NarL/FixJ family response regulator
MAIRVIIADDFPIVLDGLAQLFAAEDDIEVVMRCANGDETLSAVRRTKPDVVVLEMRLPGRNGLDVLRAFAGRAACGARRVVHRSDQ